jgi:predicted GIY-YIG superfamily endonuclease
MGSTALRDRLLARIAEMGGAPDHQRLAAEVLGIRGAPPALARTLVAQALVIEDRRELWQRAGERICRDAPSTPAVYILKDAAGAAVYVGKAINLRRRLRAHFAERRWRSLKPAMSRIVDAEWIEVGSDLEALLREASLIAELRPAMNVQVGAPALDTRAIPETIVRDVVAILPSIEDDSVELVAARTAGAWLIQRTRRNGADLAVHSKRLRAFFQSPARKRSASRAGVPTSNDCAPIVFSWLHLRGARTTRFDPHDSRSAKELGARLAAALRDDRLFHERLEQC